MKIRYPTLDNIVPLLVAFVTASIVGMTFINYSICNFKVVQSLHFLYLADGFSKDKKPPSKCDDNTSQSIQTLMSLLATIIALKADLRKKDEINSSSSTYNNETDNE
jgi:hypothetical protein